jgi:hypothetical protein
MNKEKTWSYGNVRKWVNLYIQRNFISWNVIMIFLGYASCKTLYHLWRLFSMGWIGRSKCNIKHPTESYWILSEIILIQHTSSHHILSKTSHSGSFLASVTACLKSSLPNLASIAYCSHNIIVIILSGVRLSLLLLRSILAYFTSPRW